MDKTKKVVDSTKKTLSELDELLLKYDRLTNSINDKKKKLNKV